MMGIGRASGENRAVDAAKQAIASPLLEQTISGATGVIFNITGGANMSLHEVHDAADIIYENVHKDANIVFGSVIDDGMKDEIMITVIATGFHVSEQPEPARFRKNESNADTKKEQDILNEIEEELDRPLFDIDEEETEEISEQVSKPEKFEKQSIELPEPPRQNGLRNPILEANDLIMQRKEYKTDRPIKHEGTLDEFDLDVPSFLRNVN